MSKQERLMGYYRSINTGRALGYNWNALAELGFDDPREVLALNNELIKAGQLRRATARNTYGDSSLFVQ